MKITKKLAAISLAILLTTTNLPVFSTGVVTRESGANNKKAKFKTESMGLIKGANAEAESTLQKYNKKEGILGSIVTAENANFSTLTQNNLIYLLNNGILSYEECQQLVSSGTINFDDPREIIELINLIHLLATNAVATNDFSKIRNLLCLDNDLKAFDAFVNLYSQNQPISNVEKLNTILDYAFSFTNVDGVSIDHAKSGAQMMMYYAGTQIVNDAYHNGAIGEETAKNDVDSLLEEFKTEFSNLAFGFAPGFGSLATYDDCKEPQIR